MEIVFEKLPMNLQEMKELEYASLTKPEYAVALYLAAMKAMVPLGTGISTYEHKNTGF